jgi:LemA protein
VISQQLNKNRKWVILSVTLAVLAIYTIVTYNGFIRKEEELKERWSTLQSRYQRRTDLIPNLVTVVQGAANFEKNTLLQLTEIRSKVGGMQLSGDPSSDAYQQLEKTQAEVAGTMNQVLAVIEKYPELKSQTSFLRFQDQIKGTENRIRIARKDFNASAAGYNRKVRSFPSSLVAGIFGFKKKNGFQSEADADKAPEVKFQK